MEALYDRMASSIAQNPSPRDRALASTILQCVACALRVLTVAELSQALGEDTSKMLDFQRSIVDLCSGFVVIDNGGNVAMIHQTAREYLLCDNNRPFHLDQNAANKTMFLSCMRYLMAIGLRAKINRKQTPEFLKYAAGAWSAHLTSASLDCGQVVKVLNSFLTGHWVLTWIQVLATHKQLRVLIQASKDLSQYSAKQKANDAARNVEHQLPVEQDLVESWAIDFVKLVGKFGRTLRENPESIYKLIPPFCPPNSIIYQLFGKMEAKSLMVSGASQEDWDDSLARISLGFGTYASSILAAGAQVAILASSGSVFIYDSTTFEEAAASPIKHGERVYKMELNRAGSLLATYGYRTTVIWEISTGKCKMSVGNIESRPRPLAMLLMNDNKVLLVGTDDRRIRSLTLDHSSPTWQLVAELDEPELEGHFLNSSSYMALNTDGNLVVVAYRGHPLSAWEIDGPVHIGHCWRKREEVARGEVIEAVWHPHFPEVLGLYIEGVVFRWRPYEGETEEIATGASRLAISRDGNLFATGDVHGTVKVFTTSDFCLLYQLASQDTVLGLAFSPDLRRFYDIRGYYGNAWEPNALLKFAEQTGKGIESESRTERFARSSTSMSWSRQIDSITVLAGSPTGRLYCCGTEKGTVRLHDTQRGKLADIHVSKGFHSIEQMSWSSDGRFICFSDSCKKVFIMSITPSVDNSDPVVKTKAEIPMKNSTKGPILQLLFQPDASHLLVHTSSTICIISLTSLAIQSLELPAADRKWIIHPQEPAMIIGLGPSTIHLLDWNLAVRQAYKFEHPLHQSMPSNVESYSDQDMVDRVLVAYSKKHILVQISLRSQFSKAKTFLYFETSSFSTPPPIIDQNRDPTTLTPTMLPEKFSSQIALLLSFLSHDRLIFLSGTFSICSGQLRSGSDLSSSSSLSTTHLNIIGQATTNSTTLVYHHHKNDPNRPAEKIVNELFSLPGDWVSRDCLTLCSIWGIERSLLCPRNGEVAVVRCAALV
jgi:hypothetical protein